MVLVYSTTKGLSAMTLALAHSRGWLDYDERVCAVLARVRAAGQGSDHGAPAAGASGRAVRVRRAGRPQRGRGPRSPRGRHGAAAAGLAARRAAGLPRAHPRVLRRRTAAADRSAPPDARSVLPGRDRRPAGARGVHPGAGVAPGRAARDAAPPGRDGGLRRRGLSDAAAAGDVQPPLEHLSRARGEPRLRGRARCAAHLRARARGAGRRRRRHRARHRTRLQRVRDRRPRAEAATETLRALAAPAIPSANGFHDDCLLAADVRYSLGFTKPSSFWPFGAEGSYGSLGAGGSMGFADPRPGSGTRTSPARWAARYGATRATSRCGTRSTRPSPRAERRSLAGGEGA